MLTLDAAAVQQSTPWHELMEAIERLLVDGQTGQLCAVLDGDELTLRRTAAVSALAADRLARPNARRLLVVGTGNLAPNLASLAAGRHPGRTSDSEITLFKSVGFALSDLAAARLVHRRIASGAVGSPDAGASHS
ncbi:MAG: hypothetical protein OXH86_15365 [Acidimicrobiaceae bacterium]|nr:hypothetical protein [Acidimicrobiaceae bacterium]